jgi:O-antigen/teichoic acid export membrane protein
LTLGRKIALNAAALGVARIANAVMGVVAVGITTRYLGLDAYGALVAALAFVGLVAVLNDIGVGTIVAREIAKRPEERDHLVGAGLTVVLALSVVGTAVAIGLMYLLYPGADKAMQREGILLLLLLPLPLVAQGAAAGAFFVSQQRAYIGAIASLGGSVLNLVLLVGVVALDWGFKGVAVAYAAQAVGFSLVMLVFARKLRLRPSRDRALSMQVFRWAVPLGAALLVGSLYNRIDVLLLSLLGSNRDVALYGLSYRFVDTLLILPAYVTITLLPEFSRLQEQRDRVAALVQKAFDVMLVGIVPLLVVFVLFAPEVSEVLGGPSFADAGPVLQVLMVGLAAGFLSAVFVEPIVALGHQRWMLYQALALLTTNVVANVILIPPFGAMGAAVAFMASQLLALVLTAGLYARLAQLPRLSAAPRILAAGAAMALVVCLKYTPIGDALGAVGELLAIGSVAGVTYVAALYLFRGVPRELHETLVQPLLRRVGVSLPARGEA